MKTMAEKLWVIALGGVTVIGIAAAITLHFITPRPAKSSPEPAGTAAAAPDANKFRQALAQASNEIRQLKKEKSALLDELGEHVAELAKPEPPPARVAQNSQTVMRKTLSIAFRRQTELKLAALKLRLHLTDEQAEAVRALLEKEDDQAVEMRTRMYEGKLTQEDISPARQFDLDGPLKQILTPDQWTGYQQYIDEVSAQYRKLAVQQELVQVSSALQLSAQQQEQVSGILQQQHQQLRALKDFTDFDQVFDAEKAALSAVLTPEQQQIYDKFIESEREETKSMLQVQTPPKP